MKFDLKKIYMPSKRKRREYIPLHLCMMGAWAFGITEPIGSVPWVIEKFGFQKNMTDRSVEELLTEASVNQKIGSVLGLTLNETDLA